MLLLGGYVFLREKHSSVRTAFFLLTLSAVVWLTAFGFLLAANDERTAIFWAKAAYLGVPFLPSCLYYFTAKVLRQYEARRRSVAAGFALSAAFSALILFTDWIVSGVHFYAWGRYPKYAPGSAAYLVFFAGYMIASLRAYIRAYRRSDTPTQRARAKCLLAAFSVAALAVMDYLPKFGFSWYPFGYACILGFIAIAAWTVTRYRLIDITSAFAADKIIGTMGDALLVLDNEDVVRVANDEACRLFGAPKEKLVGVPLGAVSSFFPRRDTAEHADRVGTDHAYEIVHRADDGKELHLTVSESAIKDALGCVIATVLVIRDFTPLAAARRALEDTENRLSGLYKDMSEAVVLLDEFGRFLSMNPAAERLLNAPVERIAGRIFVMSNFLPSRHMATVMRSLRNVMAGGPEERIQIELCPEGGEPFLATATASAVRAGGRVSAVQLLVRRGAPEGAGDEAFERARKEVETKVRAVLKEIFKDNQDIVRKLERLRF
jgi:PAS domain S-box-containing protein